jgi:hypothetical protein
MRSVTGLSAGQPAADPGPPRADRVRALSAAAIAGIGGSILIMVALSLVRDSWMYPPIVLPAFGPPWDLQSVHVSFGVATVAVWLAILAGTGGVIAGLLAIERGARPNVRWLLVTAAVVVGVLTVLPPAGSTDVFDYAAYGRIVVLGHSPYVMTPYHLRVIHDTFAKSVPVSWQHYVSVYGPLATFEQFLAAKLGGVSVARITFWLKLWSAIAFGIVALVADRLLRGNPVRRLRAHLLWTINPPLLWALVAEGHVDVLAAAAGLAGLVVLGEQSGATPPRLLRVLASGALIGVAADIKINYVLFGLAVAWALRRSLVSLAAAAGAALVVLVPSYAWWGMPAVRALVGRRNEANGASLYRILPVAMLKSHLALIAGVLVVAMAILALRRMPPGMLNRPALRPAVVLSVAWLFFWPYQFPWYDAMILCVLVLYPASRLDWLVLARIAACSIPNAPGNPANPPGRIVGLIHQLSIGAFVPLVLLGAAVCLVALCLSGRWKLREPGGPPGAAPETAPAVPSAVG